MTSSVAAVSPVSRRIFLYWVLLLVPTLVVGAGAILLLRREQARLTEQGAYAVESRQAAAAGRARLIVESVELLTGDVQALLLDTLAEQPEESVEEFMEGWEQANPLVRTAFRVDAGGRLLRPAANASDEEARGFVRRFAGVFRGAAPWALAAQGKAKAEQVSPTTGAAPAGAAASAVMPAVPPVATEAKGVVSSGQKIDPRAENAARREVDANVAQVQSARRDVQELFNSSNMIAVNEAASKVRLADEAKRQVVGEADGARAEKEKRSADIAGSERAGAGAAPSVQRRGNASAPSATAPSAAAPVAPAAERARGQALADSLQAKPSVAKDALVAARRGWTPQIIDGKLHLIAWVLMSNGTVRGVEVEMAALVSRLASTLPGETSGGEGYALRDANGQIVHQVGAVALRNVPSVAVPLAMALLPGWSVEGYLPAEGRMSFNDGGFLWVGTVLVAIFVTASVAGGSLLWRQARRSEDEAAQKTSFVANVSHEFKTPLTTIRLYSELLEQGRVRDREQGNEYLRTIGRETQRLARLVNNALDFSRLEQGRKKFARERVELGAEVGRLIDTHAPRVAEAGLELRREMPAERIEVTTDRDALEQIVLNLVDNACKYAAEGGEVRVLVRARENGGAEVSVGDRGAGVPAEHRERIFEKFHRVDETLTAEKTGAGLGLSIARQLARGLGGELRYRPRDGGGAEFILELT